MDGKQFGFAVTMFSRPLQISCPNRGDGIKPKPGMDNWPQTSDGIRCRQTAIGRCVFMESGGLLLIPGNSLVSSKSNLHVKGRTVVRSNRPLPSTITRRPWSAANFVCRQLHFPMCKMRWKQKKSGAIWKRRVRRHELCKIQCHTDVGSPQQCARQGGSDCRDARAMSEFGWIFQANDDTFWHNLPPSQPKLLERFPVKYLVI